MTYEKLKSNNNRTLIKVLLIIWGILLLFGCLGQTYLKREKENKQNFNNDTIQKKANNIYIYRKN
jgi:flagellar basal body-associated protein FliL